MKLPRRFYQPLATGAPAPYRELPVRLERMIHFVPPHLEKVRAKIPELITQVDVVLGNLEDAIPADAKVAARRGFIELAKDNTFGGTGLWTRINALNSAWVLDDLTEIVAAVGNKLDVVMLPKVEGPWDIHYIDQFLAQLEARHGVGAADHVGVGPGQVGGPDGDAAVQHLRAQAVREGLDAGLARAVRAHQRRRHQRGQRRDLQHVAAAGDQVRQERAHRPCAAHEVDIDDAVPGGGV